MDEQLVESQGVELLAPAGNFQTALAAFKAGADAVYCGLPDFSARAFADNLTLEDLKNLIRYAHHDRKKVYVTFNTLIDEDDIEPVVEQLARLDEVRPDALIVQDIGVARLCRTYFPELVLHASTQLVAHNLEGVLAMKELGFSRVVLARELSLAEIASISKRCGVELECFIHGALCYSVSGLCLFGAMEKGRSGNRGKCPYCCRLPYDDGRGGKTLAFSMKDLRLGADVVKLADAGVASLKIEGRMKSELYVASVTRYYRQILGEGERKDGRTGKRENGRTGKRENGRTGKRENGRTGNREEGKAGEGENGRTVTLSDLETVFSRRTTELYFNGRSDSPIDPSSLGHLGAEIGVVKRVTKDRDGLSWLRFHTARALEKHDGLQFEAMVDGRHLGLGISEMRQAISRHPVFEVAAGTDVEILLGGGKNDRQNARREDDETLAKALKPGMKIYCSASQAVRRRFPVPSFRPSDYAGDLEIDLEVTLKADGLSCRVLRPEALSVAATVTGELQPAKNPEKTFAAVEKAFSKLGETDYRLGRLSLADTQRLFAPMSLLNDLRRDLVEQLDALRDRLRRSKVDRALRDDVTDDFPSEPTKARRLKIRIGQKIPAGSWDEIVVAVSADVDRDLLRGLAAEAAGGLRLALPVYTKEPDFNRLRVMIKGLLREGFVKWEASDLATLRMLKQLGVEDVTADWTLYAFNLSALRQHSELGVRRFVASPENGRDNLQFLAESGYDVEFLEQQSTPLFVSLTEPASSPSELSVFARDGLWVTTKPVPRTFFVPEGGSSRVDLSWDPE